MTEARIAKDPPRYQGPFVDTPRGGGLLRRLFRGGGGESPTDPHHHETSVHPAEPDAMPQPRRAAPMPSFGGAPQGTHVGGGLLAKLFGWLWRAFGFRLIFTAVALGVVLLGSNAGSEVGDMIELPDNLGTFGTVATTPAPPPPGPAPRQLEGTDVVTVNRVVGSTVTVTDLGGRRQGWVVRDRALARQLAAARGQRVVASWKRDSAGRIVVHQLVVAQRT